MNDNILKIYCWGQHAGTLTWSEKSGTSLFSYDPKFAAKGYDLFPLLYPLSGAASSITYIGRRTPGTKDDGLPPFIADSLPDDWGSRLFADWLQHKNINPDRISRLKKLSYIGRRGPGALEFVPEIRLPRDRDDLRLAQIVHLAAKIYSSRSGMAILPDEDKTLQRLFALGSSAGGRRPKAFLAIDRDTGEIRSGQVMQKDSFDYYILKMDDNGAVPFNAIEMTYYDMAVAAGLPMMPSRLIDVEDNRCFLTLRYDRSGGKKLHTQSLAAIRPSADTYGKLLETCRLLGLPQQDSQTAFRQAVFNVFSGNTDDHPRNFGFILPEGGQWRLSPPYDINYIIHDLDEGVHGAHCMSIGGKTSGITEEDLMRLAEDNTVRHPKDIIESTCHAITTFAGHARRNGLPPYWAARIERDLQRLAPERFKEQFNTWAVTSAILDIDGVPVTGTRFEMTTGGNFRLSSTIGAIEARKVFANDRPECRDIILRGGDSMTETEKTGYIRKYLCPVALKASGRLTPQLARTFDHLSAFGFAYRDLLELSRTGLVRVKDNIYHTAQTIRTGKDTDKPTRRVDIELAIKGNSVILSNPFSGRELGEAVSVLESGYILDLGNIEAPEKRDNLSRKNTPHL